MEKQESKIGIIIVILIIGVAVYWFSNNSGVKNPTLDVKTDIKEINTHRKAEYSLEGEMGDADFFKFDECRGNYSAEL